MAKQPVYYLQVDTRWANLDYSASGEATTIGESGCGPTCAAMIIATLKNSEITPVDTCSWALKHGYKCKGSGTYYSYFKAQGEQYGLKWEQLNWSDLRNIPRDAASPIHKKAVDAIKNGDLVICCMGPGNWTRSGHFILWYDLVKENGVSMVYINDPVSTKTSRRRSTYALLQSEVKYYFICHMPKEGSKMTAEQVKQIVDVQIAEALQRRNEETLYPTIADVPVYYKPSVEKLMKAGLLRGENAGKDGNFATLLDNSIRVDETFCKIVTVLDRAGLLKLDK